MDAKAEAEKRYTYGDDGDDAWGLIAADRTNFLAGAEWALREAARESSHPKNGVPYEVWAWCSGWLKELADGIDHADS